MKEVGGIVQRPRDDIRPKRHVDNLALAREYDVNIVIAEAHRRARQGRSSVVGQSRPYGRPENNDLTPHYVCYQSYVWHLCAEVSPRTTPLWTFENLDGRR